MRLEIALCQLAPSVGSPDVNASRIISVIEGSGSDVAVFPEGFLSGYGTVSDKGDTERCLGMISDACRELGKAVATGATLPGDDGVRNVLAFLSPDGDSFYDKIHLARFGIYAENGYKAGNGPAIGRYRGIGFGLSICYDLFFPEVLHGCALNGSEIGLCISAAAVPSMDHFRRVMPARALENVSYLAYVNNIGNLSGLDMGGGSSAYGPLGNEIVRMDRSEGIATFSFDSNELERARNERHHLEDFRRDVQWFRRGPFDRHLY